MPVIPCDGGILSISANGGFATGPGVSFADSNNVSFGVVGNTITASVVPDAGIGLAVPGTTIATGTVVFSNSNNVSFGINGSTVTASVVGGGGVNFAAGTQTATSGTAVLANSNGFTFGMSGSSQITASYAGPIVQGSNSTGGIQAAFMPAGSTLLFSNSNNASFWLSTNPTSVVAVLQYAAPRAISAGTQSGATNGTLSFSNGSGVSFGLDGNTLTASVAAGASATGNLGAIAAGTQTATSGTVMFSSSNGVIFGMSGSSQVTARIISVSGTAGQDVSIVASGAPIIVSNANSNIIVSAGGLGEAYLIGNRASVLGDAVGIADQSNRTIGFYGVAGATRQTITGTNATAFNNLMAGLQSLGVISNGATMSAFATGNIGAISAAGSSGSSGTIVFSNSNGVSFGMNGNTITASVAPGLVGVDGFFAGLPVSMASDSILQFSNVSNVWGATSGPGTLRVNLLSGPISASAGTQSMAGGPLVFANSNGVTFGMSGSSQITASVAGGGTIAGWTMPPGPVSTFYAGVVSQSRSLQRVSFAQSMTATQAVLVISATNNATVLASLAIYTFSGSTANTVSSIGSTLNYSSNGPATNLTFAGWNITPGEYLLGFAVITNNAPSWLGSQSFPVPGGITPGYFRCGVFTRPFGSSLHFTHVSQTAASASITNFGFPYIELMG